MLKVLLQYSYSLEVFFCLAILAVMLKRSLASGFKILFLMVVLRAVNRSCFIALLFHRTLLGISREQDLRLYYMLGWVMFLAQGILVCTLIYTTFWEAMRPLEGLHKIGKIIFRWVTVVSLIFATTVVLGPHDKSAPFDQALASRFNDGISVLTLCLLLFVCFAISPLGLTFRSRVFGISLGLGMMTLIDLIQSGWLASSGASSLYSPIYLVNSVGAIIGLSIWLTYFLIDEPERMMILLPTTSPFFFWNKVSEVLGDEPGYVAVGGIKPQMLAAAELKALGAAQKQAAAGQGSAAETLADPNASFPSAAAR